MLDYLKMAAKIAVPTDENDPRSFWLGAIGIRSDGVMVSSKNGAVFYTSSSKRKIIPGTHAEVRCVYKCDKGSTIYVARVARGTRQLAMSRPCRTCQSVLKSKKVAKVYYTINNHQYGIWYPDRDTDFVVTKSKNELIQAILEVF